MLLTDHARKRIVARSKLKPEEVLAIIKADMAISLGVHDGAEFLLFWSTHDCECKIAVTREDRTALLSLWNLMFHLPEDVKRPTKELMRDARVRYRRFSFTHMEITQIPKIPQRQQYFTVSIEVTEGGVPIFLKECGAASYTEGKKKEFCYQLCKEDIMLFASLVETNKEKLRGEVRYHIVLQSRFPPIHACKRFVVLHEHVLKDLRKQAAH